jgi:UDP-N-acetylglucosamine 2-epimerase
LLVSVVGARPQFIKLAPVAAAFQRARLPHVIIHTGQHYDDEMSARFFRELTLPRPDLNLGVQGGGHAEPTAKMLARLARVFEEIRPTAVVVYGDTTSTLAGALAGAQCGVPVAHVESGLRSYQRNQPEERNRVVADHLATWLFAPTREAVANLREEGLRSGVHLVGDPMHDALSHFWPVVRQLSPAPGAGRFVFVTVHRAENTDDPGRLRQLTRLLESIRRPLVFPLHPRTREALKRERLYSRWDRMKHLILLDPLGYLQTLKLISQAYAVLTDSGGVQREAAWLGTPCLTLRSVTEWGDTVANGANTLVDLSVARTRRALAKAKRRPVSLVRRTSASERIAGVLRVADAET